MFVKDLGFGDDGHEVGVAVPTGHDVLVDVVGDAGAGDLAGVDAEVEALRLEHLAQDAKRTLGQRRYGARGRRRQVLEVGEMRARRNHQVAVVVRVAIEQGERQLGARKHEELGIARGIRGGRLAKEAAIGLRTFDEVHPPGRPQVLHR